ncbi:C39 family peptidase, partial [Christensenellaceae bacterium OttesenSCG-928-K19]|nr:C39 family peptidase [Christensenellaceae bacterium OttesenSCG-928-K19]
MYKKMMALILAAALSLALQGCAKGADGGNYTDEMKIPYGRDLAESGGADSVERIGDHKDSPYFSRLDFYNMNPDETLSILPKFKTIQQTSEFSCGIACILMILEYYGAADGVDEWDIARLHPYGLELSSTSLGEAVSIFDEIEGFRLTTTKEYGKRIYEEFTLATIQEFIEEGIPVMVCWNDWGGHWQVVIGYD